jgi:hypothetical protein
VSSILDELLAAAPAPGTFTGLQVGRSPDFDRVNALPRRDLDLLDVRDIVVRYTARYRTPNGAMMLRPIQALALHDAAQCGGLLAPIGVGQGKTLITLLLGTVFGAQNPVIIVPASMVKDLGLAARELAKHWSIGPWLSVSYSELSSTKSGGVLTALQPDLVIADEAHLLAHPDSARTKRFLRYFEAHPRTRLCALSGTLNKRSIRDYAHLSALALRQGSPLPLSYYTAAEWAEALDVETSLSFGRERRAPGVLLGWCEGGETAREGVRRRILETPGVVATTDSALDTCLEVRPWRPSELNDAAKRAAQVAATGQWLDEELDPVECASKQKQLAQGFYYERAWPGDQPDTEWLAAKNGWARAVTAFLAHSAQPGLDSPALVRAACERGDARVAEYMAAWARWAPLRARPEPATRPVWLDAQALCNAVQGWVRGPQSIVWYAHRAVGETLARELGEGLVYVPPGAAIGEDHHGRALLLSIASHGVGKNLQPWCENLVLCPPSAGHVWEQLIGRTHRPGQLADSVTFDVLCTAPAHRTAIEQARRDAQYVVETTGQAQKLALATWVGW